MRDDRGQVYTLEGIIGAVLIASALVLGLQAVDISPWTDDNVDQGTESLRVQVEDLLSVANDRGDLRTVATCIDGDGNESPHPAVAAGGTQNATDRASFATLLNRTLEENNHRYRVSVVYPDENATGGVSSATLTPERGVTRPSVTVTQQLALFDSDPVLGFDPNQGECVPVVATNDTLGQRDADPDADIYVGNQNRDSDIYAVVKVRVVAW
ncbi:MAG: hypothetical protein V5A39_06295 [Haloarculaceae archaeon]